jgi:hypothetical protein
MKSKVIQTLLGLLAMGMMFAFFELMAALAFKAHLAVRTAKPEVSYPYHPYLGWENRTNYFYHPRARNHPRYWAIRTDSLGESVTPLESFPDPDVSVAVVGGSVIFGVGQTDNQYTVPSQIERELCRRTGLRIEVHNLAVGGYTSFQEMLALRRFLNGHDADVIVSISGHNDAVAAAIEGGSDFGLLPHSLNLKAELVRSVERGDLIVLPVAAGLLVASLRRHSNAIDLVCKLSDRLAPAKAPPPMWAGVPMPDSAEIVRCARLAMMNYAMMDGMARQRGARFFMFLQPTVTTRKRLTGAETEALESLGTSRQVGSDFLARTLPVERAFYRAAIAAPKSFEFHDLTRCFDDFAGPAFRDECHYRDDATATPAAAVCDLIAPAVVEAARRRVPERRRAPRRPRVRWRASGRLL